MENITVTKDNRDIELRIMKKNDQRQRYESIAKAYSEYIARRSKVRKENGNNAV